MPHSYALVNQWQCLELLRRPGVSLAMRDLPYYAPKWKRMRGLMPRADEQAIAGIAGPKAGATPDAVLRISVPVDLAPAPSGRTLVLGTADFGWLPTRMIRDGRSLKEAHAGTDVVLVTPSTWSQQGLVRCGADPRRVAIVPHGVDSRIFHPAKPQNRERMREVRRWQDKFVFLNISAMTLSKGIDLLLKAFATVAQRHPHTRLMLKGSDAVYKSEEWLKRWWKEKLTAKERAALKGRVVYTGDSLPVGALANLFRAADCYVTPYRSESFNLPALEAVASGLPLICTAGGPTDEYTTGEFARRISARLVPKVKKDGDPEEVQWQPSLGELTEAMLAMVDGQAYRESARAAGPAHVAERFSWRAAVDGLVAVMKGDRQ